MRSATEELVAVPPPPEMIRAAVERRTGVLQRIGDTPLVRLDRINPNKNVELYAKLERNNPGGSVKDRVALSMIEAAERSGELTPGKMIIEATSGNTGIGLAIVAAVKGYKVKLVMQEAASVERKKTLAALGAELHLTPAAQGVDGAIEYAYRTATEDPDVYYLPDQYNNPHNPLAHYYGTSLEIWQQTGGRITHFVAALGTSGTLMGNGRRLRELNPAVEIVAVEPYLGHRLQGMKNLHEAYVPGIFDKSVLTRKLNVEDDTAFEMCRTLARTEGLFVGMSSGAAVAGAIEVAARLKNGVMVVILPDGGGRYLSTPLFQVAEDIGPAPKLALLNTMSRRVEPFEPVDGGEKVRLYCCGPTAHALPHLGLMRRIVVADVVQRTLRFAGYQPELVMNITDVDDKTLAAAEEAGVPLAELTERHIADFHRDREALGCESAAAYPRASAHVDAMMQRTRELIERGFAYEKHKSVYFDVSRRSGYGQLSGVDLSMLQVGATVDLESYDKDNPRDFALVKRSTLAEIRKGTSYKTEWGQVRPSWHVECAAIAMELLGAEYDIHLGGHDLVFPHHENEIAVCESLTGKQPAKYWLHSAIVTGVDGKKMSHSAGNAVSVRGLVAEGFSGREIRFYLLSTNYRQPFGYSRESLEAAATALRRVDALVARLGEVDGEGCHDQAKAAVSELKARFAEHLFSDLNVSAALSELFQFTRRMNRLFGLGCVGREDARQALELLCELDAVLGTGLPEAVATTPEVERLVAEREAARSGGDYARADALRDRLAGLGVDVSDGPDGPRLRRGRKR